MLHNFWSPFVYNFKKHHFWAHLGDRHFVTFPKFWVFAWFVPCKSHGKLQGPCLVGKYFLFLPIWTNSASSSKRSLKKVHSIIEDHPTIHDSKQFFNFINSMNLIFYLSHLLQVNYYTLFYMFKLCKQFFIFIILIFTSLMFYLAEDPHWDRNVRLCIFINIVN